MDRFVTWVKANRTALLYALGAALVVGGALALLLRPTPVEYREKLVVDEKEVTRRVEAARLELTAKFESERKVTTRIYAEETRIDGTVRRVTTDRVAESSSHATVAAVEVRTVEKIVDRVVKVDREVVIHPVLPQWRVGVEGGASVALFPAPVPTWTVGASVDRRLAGPVWAGIGARYTGSGEIAAVLRLSLEF